MLHLKTPPAEGSSRSSISEHPNPAGSYRNLSARRLCDWPFLGFGFSYAVDMPRARTYAFHRVFSYDHAYHSRFRTTIRQYVLDLLSTNTSGIIKRFGQKLLRLGRFKQISTPSHG